MTPSDEKRIRENPYNGTVVTELLAALDEARKDKEQAEARLQEVTTHQDKLALALVTTEQELASSIQYSKTLDENYRKLQLQLSQARRGLEVAKELFDKIGHWPWYGKSHQEQLMEIKNYSIYIALPKIAEIDKLTETEKKGE